MADAMAWHDEACERRHMWARQRNHMAQWIYWMPGKDIIQFKCKYVEFCHARTTQIPRKYKDSDEQKQEVRVIQCLLAIAQQLLFTLINGDTQNNAPQPHHVSESDFPDRRWGFMMMAMAMTMVLMRMPSSCWLFYNNAKQNKERHICSPKAVKKMLWQKLPCKVYKN